ncbi:MAG: phosphatase PAP2 family protein, partial [Clostridia bacterium]|nr:phosphatase PAP2 family protein [Clostridia bacterium]
MARHGERVAPAIAFLAWSLTVASGVWHGLDVRVTAALQAAVPSWWDPWLTVFSVLGLAEVTGLVALALALAMRASGRPHSRSAATRRAAAFVAGFAATFVVEAAFKMWLFHPGPEAGVYTVSGHTYEIAARSRIGAWLAALPVFLPSDLAAFANAYPSGHMARTTYLLAWLASDGAGRRRRLWSAVALAFGLAMAVSRVVLAEHWPSEVIGGALLGWAAAA